MNALKLLIVEDEKITAMLIREALEDRGYHVINCFATGEEALESISMEQPDIILIDIFINGEIDGIDTVTQIKSSLNIPIIYITANTDENTRERARKTNPISYLSKPFKLEDLYSAMEKAEKELNTIGLKQVI